MPRWDMRVSTVVVLLVQIYKKVVSPASFIVLSLLLMVVQGAGRSVFIVSLTFIVNRFHQSFLSSFCANIVQMGLNHIRQ